ncbi:MAG: GNAT family N-acetyltransferase [Geminicoccaceae bacterium]|nr:GNAT family N-acetyltransferase [Geminicoccaceae bacterium]MCS7268789.1 GNAT family N-acetyltransferase [Geminicoccaceae bacterium]MCX7630884.1 GNAT family N-acetyltransferase [Geminicoccaceae bacterium]MDW8125878.1 GNAT family N-acetyltransferase [Geminicoccaceae bacterium]MDW8340511.1 GNAT family N-acetyltransferase [Geminicoccaceae bacterium]
MFGRLRANTLAIRPVGPFDLGRLARLHRRCFAEPWSRADLAHLLAMPGAFGLIARLFEGGLSGLDAMRGVGFAIARVVRDESELLSLGVAPPWRRRRIGSALLRAAMERARAAGARVMYLEVAVDNFSAQELYRAHGFERVGLRPDYYQRADGSRVSAHTMRCDLDRACGRFEGTAADAFSGSIDRLS